MRFISNWAKDFYFRNKKFLGVGIEGNCLKIDNERVAKLYHKNVLKKYEGKTSREKLLEFKDIQIDNFYFIKELIWVRFQMIGSIMPFVEGINLEDKVLGEISIDELCADLENLINSINCLSSEKIMVDDILRKNTIYNNGFHFIDTGCFFYSNQSFSNVFYYNVKEIIGMILYELFYELFIHFDVIRNLLEEKYCNWCTDLDILCNPREFLFEIKKALEEKVEQEIYTFNDSSLILIRRNVIL